MVRLAALLAVIMIALDEAFPDPPVEALEWVYTSSPDGVRSLLSTIAGSMISVAGVTFSITIATLTLASSQLGPRLLNNFMRDRGNQVVLGTFVANFVYCLLVLRAVRSPDEIAFVPHLAAMVGVFLTIVSLGVLIYFFDHVSSMIQANNLIARIGDELESSIDRLFSKHGDSNRLRRDEDIPDDLEKSGRGVEAGDNGYLQAVDYEALCKAAYKANVLLKLRYRPGDFVPKGSEIVLIYPGERDAETLESLEAAIHGSFALGADKLRLQDVEFTIYQLVEIAVRSLSPGINDPFTAITCLNQFGSTLADLAERTIPSGYYYDDEDHLRVISRTITFEGIINASFDQIRQHSRTDVAVTIRLLEVLALISARARTHDQRAALLRQAEMIKRASDEAIPETNDRRDIAARYDYVCAVVNGAEGAGPER